jgi:hypothetical protein
VAFEGVGQEEVGQGRVALEADAEHLVGLAFVPGGTRVDVHGGREDRGLVRDRGAHEQAADRGQGHHVGRDAEARGRFVDRAQPVEIGAAQFVTGHAQRVRPVRGRYVDGEDLVRLLGRGLRAEQFVDGGGEPADRAHQDSSEPEPEVVPEGEVEPEGEGEPEPVGDAATGGFTRPLCSAVGDGRVDPDPYRSPSDSRAIFSWSFRMPWRRASGRGGRGRTAVSAPAEAPAPWRR